MEDGSVLPVLVENRTGYKNLCELLTQAHLRSEKGKCAVRWNELRRICGGAGRISGERTRLQRAGWQPSQFAALCTQTIVRSARLPNAAR